MLDIAENFVPEYSDVLLALIGAKFINSNGNLKETSEIAQDLLMHNQNNKFPEFKNIYDFTNQWNKKPYSKILNFHYKV